MTRETSVERARTTVRKRLKEELNNIGSKNEGTQRQKNLVVSQDQPVVNVNVRLGNETL